MHLKREISNLAITKCVKSSLMSSEIVFANKNSPNGLNIENIFHIADCCRACLRIECSLTPTNTADNDSIKFCEKLHACVAEVGWLKEGLPSLICANCIDRLRVAYDFKNACLQSDQTLQRYVSHLQEEEEKEVGSSFSAESLGLTNSKFDFTIPVGDSSLPIIIEEEQQTGEFLHLKHFLDNEEELSKQEAASNNIELAQETETVISENYITESFNAQNQILHIQTTDCDGVQLQIQSIQSITQPIQIETQELLEEHENLETLQVEPPKQIIKRSTGVQVRPLTPALEAQAESKQFQCSICFKNYRKNANLRIHMRTHTGEKPFECKYCDKRFYHSSHLREHIRRHTGEKPYQCAVCTKRFTIRGELTMHMKSHTGEKPYACNCCDRRCLTAADLKVHMRTHTGEKPFSCVTCNKKFASTYILNSHIKTHTGERPYSCQICSKTFTQSSHLNVHMRKHTGEKVSCKRCDAKFNHSSQLTVHMREHTGKQPYKCKVCDKICNYSSELQTHMMKHTGEKFSCDVCSKKFTTLAYLQEHIRTHTGQNLSTCPFCDRQFTRQQYLEKHIRTHTGEKPFSCSACGKKFTQTSSLKVHMRIHTGERPYPCTVCEKTFITSSDLSAHSKKHKKYITL